MFRSILVPLDGSSFGEQALPLALGIARRSAATLKIMHVHQFLDAYYAELQPTSDTLEESLRQQEKTYLEDVAERMREAGAIKVSTVFQEGLVAAQVRHAGRTGVFEVLGVSDALRHLIYKRANIGALHRQACADAMLPFRLAALIKMAKGETTAEELLRIFPANYLVNGANPERPVGRLPRRRRRSFGVAVPEA